MIKKTFDSYKNNIFSFIFGPLLKMIEAVFDLLIPLFMKAIIDLSKYNDPEAIPNPFSSNLAKFIRSFGTWIYGNQSLNDAMIGFVIILVMGIIGFMVTMVTQYIAAKTAMKVGTEVRENLYSKILSFSKKEREKIGSSKLLTILNADTYQVQQGVLIFIRLIVRAPFIILGALTISFILNWKIDLIFLAIIPLILIIVFVIMNKSSKEYMTIQSKLDNLSNSTSDTIEGSKVIRAFNKQDYENSHFNEKTNDYKKSAIHVNKINSLINPLTFAIVSIATVLVVVIGGYPMIESATASDVDFASTIITEVAYLAQIFTTLVQLTNVVLVLTKARVSRKRVDSVLSIEPLISNDPNNITKNIKIDEEIIRFDNVSLGYEDEGNFALTDISFSLNKGQSLGIIGGTGSGKSSLINLIERFVDCSKGDVFYKGENIKKYNLSNLRSEIGFVPQKSTLFKGTIKSNLLMANENATDLDIEKALKYSMAHEFVSKYDDYINHEVEEEGKNFSGGQRQRLCIARALLKNPETIILDDSTSALDLLTDKKVRENIYTNFNGITKIIVSQRVSTIMDCDLILVLDGGHLVGKGKHDDLLKDCDIYRETYESQVKKEAE